MTSSISKRNLVLFILVQLLSMTLLVLLFSPLRSSLSSVLQITYMVVALLVVVANVWLTRKVMTSKISKPTVANQLKAVLACFALLALSCLRFFTTALYYQKVLALIVGCLSVIGIVLFLWGIKYVNGGSKK